MVPGDAEDAAEIEDDEEQGEDEPPHLLNGTAPFVCSCCRHFIPPFVCSLLGFLSTSSHFPLSLASRVSTFSSSLTSETDRGHSHSVVGETFVHHYKLHTVQSSAQNIRPTDPVKCYIRRMKIMQYVSECLFLFNINSVQMVRTGLVPPMRTDAKCLQLVIFSISEHVVVI